MKKLFLLLFSAASFMAYGQNKKEISIIPEPVSMVRNAGSFVLPENIVIKADNRPDLRTTTEFLTARLSVPTGLKVAVYPNAGTATIYLQLNKVPDTEIKKEGYKLRVTPESVVINANEPAGLFYGAQTFIQLFPKEIESKQYVRGIKWEAPSVNILDYPRFGWRGLMFDVARHFFTKEEVKDFIDQMVRYKYNLLHLHLTDDEGWRIQIKSLPRLTEVGAWNVKKEGYFGYFSPPAPDEPRNYGGFYTQEDIKEIVRYAKDRHVDILPEIDVPGHSLAAIASYPELSCTPDAVNYRVRSGEPIMDWSRGAPPIALVDNALCPANEKVYEFVDKVVTEVAELFPFEYIHMGGDEAAHNYWENNDQVKALMKREGLKTIEEVQGYFTKRVEGIVNSKGKKFIGWDEILEGGLTPNAAVMSWRGLEGGIKAAKMGHEVVMSPTTFAYIDYMQGDPAIEPKVYATLRLNKAYQFEPLPEGVNPALIKGGQANLWTEQIYNMRHAQYMTWPRGWAIAESLWSPASKRNWTDFAGRVENHFGRYDVAEIKYAPSIYDPIITARKGTGNEIQVVLDTEIEGLDIYYSFDNSFPDRFYPKYNGPVSVPKDAGAMRMITYRGKEPIGRMITVQVTDLKKRIK